MRSFVLLTVAVVAAMGIGVGIESQFPASAPPPIPQPSMRAITAAFNTLGTDQRFEPDLRLTARISAAAATRRALARSAANQARVLGAALGHLSGVRYRVPVIAWMVAIDRPGLHLPPSIPPDLAHPDTARTVSQYNLDVVFVDAETGQWLQETEATSPLLPSLPPVTLKG